MGIQFISDADVRGIIDSADISQELLINSEKTVSEIDSLQTLCSNFINLLNITNKEAMLEGQTDKLAKQVNFFQMDNSSSPYDVIRNSHNFTINQDKYRNIMMYGSLIVEKARTLFTGEEMLLDFGASTPEGELVHKTVPYKELWDEHKKYLHSSLSRSAVILQKEMFTYSQNQISSGFSSYADTRYNTIWQKLQEQIYFIKKSDLFEGDSLPDMKLNSMHIEYYTKLNKNYDKNKKGSRRGTTVAKYVYERTDPESGDIKNIPIDNGWIFEWLGHFMNNSADGDVTIADLVTFIKQNETEDIVKMFMESHGYDLDNNPGIAGGDYYDANGQAIQSKFGNYQIISFHSIAQTIYNLNNILVDLKTHRLESVKKASENITNMFASAGIANGANRYYEKVFHELLRSLGRSG